MVDVTTGSAICFILCLILLSLSAADGEPADEDKEDKKEAYIEVTGEKRGDCAVLDERSTNTK